MKKTILIFLWLFTSSYLFFGQLSPGELAEAHKQLEGLSNCTQCHSIGSKVPNQKCLDCHKEIQSLINQRRGYHVSSVVKSKTCIDCHNEHHGRKFDLVRFNKNGFNHNLTGYKLTGKHKSVDCRDCHKPAHIANRKIRNINGTYLGMGHACLSCHEDYHQTTLGKDCTSCHNQNAWDPASKFDHNKAKFKLIGAHQNVDCIKCHKETKRNNKDYQQFSGITFSNCTACHRDQHHGSFGYNCKQCHNENSWVNLNPGIQFDHSKADFPLLGKHLGVDCRKCHTSGHYTTAIDFSHCKNCHKDYHNGQFTDKNPAVDCQDCHRVTSPFTYTLYGLSEHQQSNFKLEGSHLATPCFACHVSNKRWEFTGLGSRCVDCHENIHKDVMSEKYYPNEDCTKCHQPELWPQVKFDHSKTDWPLEGKHIEVSCRTCHFETTEQKGTIIQHFQSLSNNCFECHENPHGSQFEEGGITDCKRCHTMAKAWNDNNFNHDVTLFPLVGKHKEVDCKACHKIKIIENNIERTEYKIKKFECNDCHSS